MAGKFWQGGKTDGNGGDEFPQRKRRQTRFSYITLSDSERALAETLVTLCPIGAFYLSSDDTIRVNNQLADVTLDGPAIAVERGKTGGEETKNLLQELKIPFKSKEYTLLDEGKQKVKIGLKIDAGGLFELLNSTSVARLIQRCYAHEQMQVDRGPQCFVSEKPKTVPLNESYRLDINNLRQQCQKVLGLELDSISLVGADGPQHPKPRDDGRGRR